MSFDKKTVRDIDIQGKRVLLRADYNVPIDKNGKITSDYRIEQSLPTIRYLLEHNCSIIIISHLGRPALPDDKSCSLAPVHARLEKLLDKKIKFLKDCIGENVIEEAKALPNGQIMLLENLRYHPEEEKNDDNFAKQLSELAEIFVQDGFGVVHRAHASTSAITKYLPSVAGLLLAKEVSTITDAVKEPKRPLMAIVGGAKISDKIGILNKLIDMADFVAIGGAMANTFLFAEGIKVGKSLKEPDDSVVALDILKRAKDKAKQQPFIFYLPQDVVVAETIDKHAKTRIVDFGSNDFAEIINYPKRPPSNVGEVLKDEYILDIGPFSGAFIAGVMQMAKTVIWNGTMGVTEIPGINDPTGPFAHGTEILIESMTGQMGNRPISIVGGGDTTGYIEERGLTKAFNHVSTGGGASLELMEGKKLPGVEALMSI